MSVGLYAGLLARSSQTARAYHVCVGEIDKAVDWFEKAVEQRDPYLPLNLAFPFAHAVRTSSRWPRLARVLNLPVKSKQE